MNRIYQFTCLVTFIFASITLHSQCDTVRYSSPIFNSITEHINVKYGAAKEWKIPYNNKDLYMNIYTPDNDTLSKRPLMIWVHPGGFLNGNKELQDMMALCDSFARRGYVTATIDYRKGFNPLSNTSAERAVYRGTQDLRAAIRYLKEKHNTYGIDTNYTFIGGSSAGAFAVIHTVYMDQNEAPASIESGFGYPALGDLDAEGNNYSHEMNITGYVNLWGAIGDSTWINPDETTKGLHVHGKSDGTVPFGVGHPFGVPTTPKTHGSRSITNQLSSLNIPHTTYFVDGQGHEFHGTSNGDWNSPPTPYWDTIYNLIENHYLSTLKKDVFPIQGNDIACVKDTLTFKVAIPNTYKVCWETINGTLLHAAGDSAQFVFENPGQAEVSAIQVSEIAVYNGKSTLLINVNANPTPSFLSSTSGSTTTFSPLNSSFVSYNWNFGDGNFSNDLNPSHTYSNTGLYNVSLAVADTNGCMGIQEETIEVSTLSIQENNFENLKVYPNPVRNILTVSNTTPLETIMMFSAQGQLIETFDIKENKHEININNISEGIYILKIFDANGHVKTSLISIKN